MLEKTVNLYADKLREKTGEEVKVIPVHNKARDYMITIGEGYCETLMYCNKNGFHVTVSDYSKEYKHWFSPNIKIMDMIIDMITKAHEEKGYIL